MRFATRLTALILGAVLFLSAFVSCSLLDGKGGSHSREDSASNGGTDNDGTGQDESGFPIVINEVCSQNNGRAVAPDGQYHDYIELYNSSKQEYSLAGYGISDKKSKIKHIFGEDVTVPAGGFLLLWACGEENMADKENGGIYLPFALSKHGEELYLFSTRGTPLFSMSVPALDENMAFGYSEDGAGVLGTMSATPGKSNGGAYLQTLDDSVMTFNYESGFYDSAFSLKITAPAGYRVYYTTDCTEPTKSSAEFPSGGLTVTDASAEQNRYSNLYMGNINQGYEGYTKAQLPSSPVDKCTVIRAVAYSPDGKRTNIVTKSYFVGYQLKKEYNNVSFVSLVSKPDSLFGTDGLFTNEDYWKKGTDAEERANERCVSFSYYSGDHNYSFEQVVGMRLHGTSTRAQNQKSLTLFARSEYGNGIFEKAIVGSASECHSMVLRGDGYTKIQEGFVQSLVADRELSTCDYTPTVVFVDGEYWGVYNLYERFSENYVKEYYGVNKDNVYIVKKGSEGNTSAAVTAYNTFYNFMTNSDLSVASNYTKLCNMVDMQSLIDLLCVEAYIGNADFSFRQNIACWRVIDSSQESPDNPYADGKWRFVLYDLDISIGAWAPAVNFYGLGSANDFQCDASYNGFTHPMIWAGVSIMEMKEVKSLMKSKSFQQQFVLTFQDIVNVNFNPTETVAKLNAALDVYQPLMKKHFARYGIPIEAYETGSKEGSDNTSWRIKTYYGGYSVLPSAITGAKWREEMQFAVDYFTDHPAYALEDLAEVFGLTGEQITVTLSVSDGSAGTLLLNGVTRLSLADGEERQAIYYTDALPTVTATAAEGYRFVRWEAGGTSGVTDLTSATVTPSATGNFSLKAVFEQVAGE